MLVDNKSQSFKNLMSFSEVLLSEGIILQVTVGGYSMFPFLRKGDIAFIEKTKTDYYQKGDIVVFKTIDKFIAHRLIYFDKKNKKVQVITKGDSLLKFDKKIEISELLGKIIRIKRGNKIIDLTTKKAQINASNLAILSPYLVPVYWIFRKALILFRKFKFI